MTNRKLRPAALIVAVIAIAVVAAQALAGTDRPSRPAGRADARAAQAPQAQIAGAKRVRLGKTRYGKILQDSRGRTLYLFTRDKAKKSRCYGACAKAWPPLITSGTPVAKKGVKQSLLGTVRRRSGKLQATYNGHPLYYYVHEDEAGEVLCQAVTEFGGVWYVVNSKGKAIRRR